MNKKVIAIIANGWLRYLPFQSLAKPTKDGELSFLISELLLLQACCLHFQIFIYFIHMSAGFIHYSLY